MNSLPEPGTGYFVAPGAEPAPGVLLLASPWGLTSAVKQKADELADAGFTVLAPDLNDGVEATDAEHAHTLLMQADMNVTASLVQSSMRLLQQACPSPGDPIGVVGYAAGGSWALWLSARFGDNCAAVVSFYGAQSISFDEAKASYLLHFAAVDPDVADEEIAMLGLNLQLARREFRIERHAGTEPGFAEAGHPDFDPAAEAVAWRQTLEFLATHLRN